MTRRLHVGALGLAFVFSAESAHAQPTPIAPAPAPTPVPVQAPAPARVPVAAQVPAPDFASDASAPLAAPAIVMDAGVPSPDASVAPAPTPLAFELDESHRPRVRVTVEPQAIHTGETVTLVIVADALATDDVTLPSQAFSPFEVHRRSATHTDHGARREHRFELVLLALEPGDLQIPPVEIRVLTRDGDVGLLRTDPLTVRVAAWLANEPNAQPKDPTRPRTLLEENPVPKYAIGALAAMLVGGLIALLLRRWWKRRPKPVPPPPPPRPAWEIAFEKLEELRRDGKQMIADGRVEPWIDALSDVVREYLGKRYGFDGLECTTRELLERFKALRTVAVSAGDLEVFLGECDLVKFAQGSMTEEQAEAMYRHAQRLVRSTIPGTLEPAVRVA